MRTSLDPGSSVAISSVPNFRDLGGWPTNDGGRVRTRLLYRSTGLYRLDGPDLEKFAKLNIRTIYDLRTEGERRAQPNRVPSGTEEVACDVLADDTDAAPARLQRVVADPRVAESVLGGGKAAALFERGYRQIVGLPSALVAYRRFFMGLSQEARRPALFHCTTGKDRTGWAAAALLTLLGVSEDDVMKDYMLTNAQLLPFVEPIMERFRAVGGDPALLEPVLGVRSEYLEASFDEMRRRYGSMEGYFANGLRIDLPTQERLKAAFIEGVSAP